MQRAAALLFCMAVVATAHAGNQREEPLIDSVRTALSLPHEGNCEHLFSGAKHRSYPNMNPSFLRILTKINQDRFEQNK